MARSVCPPPGALSPPAGSLSVVSVMTGAGVHKANDPCWCGSGQKFKRCHKASYEQIRPGRLSPTRTVPDAIARPSYAETGEVDRWPEPTVKSPEVIERMRRTGRDAAAVLNLTGQAIAPGVTTDELDAIAHAAAIERDAYPSPLNYQGYPKSLCTSVNEVICHGIPDDRPLVDGDIVNLDVTIFREGVHGDTNATFLVGKVDPDSQRLVRVTRECLERGIEAVRPGRPVSEIGRAIQTHAEAHGYGVVRAFVGHGIGEQFHTDFHVPHYHEPRLTTVMEPGMTFTIEPMITLGSWDHRMWDDDWTAVTKDLRRTAQYEHTLVVTDDGAEVLTAQQEPLPFQP
jgi:methionyl aminopeptidase